MPADTSSLSAAVLSILELIHAKLDAIGAELKRRGWWSGIFLKDAERIEAVLGADYYASGDAAGRRC